MTQNDYRHSNGEQRLLHLTANTHSTFIILQRASRLAFTFRSPLFCRRRCPPVSHKDETTQPEEAVQTFSTHSVINAPALNSKYETDDKRGLYEYTDKGFYLIFEYSVVKTVLKIMWRACMKIWVLWKADFFFFCRIKSWNFYFFLCFLEMFSFKIKPALSSTNIIPALRFHNIRSCEVYSQICESGTASW